MLVAGVGASAGGVEAVTSLLSALPPKLDMTIVIVQHLAPAHESLLPEIFARATPIPVLEVTDGMAIESRHVYVIPPNTNLTITDGTFQLGPYVRVRGWHKPVDDFFKSIAEHFHHRAIGIVLSGAASDGAIGCRAIKGEGGITFAQTAESARFSEMPLAAIASGAVDFVLSPREIAAELDRISRFPPADAEAEAPAGVVQTAYQRILAALRTATGVDFSQYRQSTIRRRISRRMVVRKVASLKEYADLVQNEPPEAGALFDDILITVTSFFRDPETFTLLKKKVFPKLLKNRSLQTPIRIWIPGCSTGEEVYSIAITLLETAEDLKTSAPVQIFATDISERAIEHARQGLYPPSIAAEVSGERLRKYFLRTENGWQISKTIRDMCVFARQNIGADPPFSNLDFISCRNLLIYLEPSLQKTILPLFHYALKPTGFLLLGSAEAIRNFGELFKPEENRHRLFSKKASAPPPLHEFHRMALSRPPVPLEIRPAEIAGRVRRDDNVELQRRADHILLSRFAPAAAVVDREMTVLSFRGAAGNYLDVPQGAATFHILKMAREGLMIPLRDAIQESRHSKMNVVKSVPFRGADGKMSRVSIDVSPLHDDARHFVVTFEPVSAAHRPRVTPKSRRRAAEEGHSAAKMEQELTATREYLQSIIEEQEATNEELTSANEEILSSNEELQSTNEELQTAKEELQSTNEELRTVNEELHQRNLELRAAHSDLSNVFSSINIPMVIVDASGKIRRYTPFAERILSVIPGDVGRPLSDLNTRIDVPNLPELVADVVHNVEGYEREIQAKDGQWYLMRIRPYRTDDKKIEGAVIAFLDIDPVKIGVDKINQARDYAETLVETMREGLLVLDHQLRVRTANRSFYSIFDTSAMRVEGRPIFEMPGWSDPNLRRLLEGVLKRREQITDVEWQLRDHPDSPPRTLVVNARSVRIANDPNPVALVAVQDVTEKKRAESEIRESEARYRRIFENAREGVLLVDAASRKAIDANPFFLQMVGLTRDRVVDRELDEIPALRHPAAPPGAWDFDGGGIPGESEIPLVAASGADVWAHRVCSAYEADGRRMIQCNLRDVTAGKLLQQQLWQAQKLESMGSLAGGIAHDFNNILGILSTCVASLRKAIPDAARRDETLAAMDKAIDRGAGFVRQILTFARGPERESRAVIDANAVVRELQAMLEQSFPQTIALSTDLAPDLAPVEADATQLHQALLNLSVNARDAMPAGGRLEIRTANSDGESLRARLPAAKGRRYASIFVHDTGNGMTTDTKRRIFEPFFTTKQEQGGSGLGLAVAYGIVQTHRGFLEVESEVGKGSTFTIHLPAADGEPKSRKANGRKEKASAAKGANSAGSSAAPSGDPRPETRGARARTVLLVEDEPLLLDSMKTLVESEGYRVLTAKDGVDAVRLYETAEPPVDVVVSDVRLPRLGGWDAFLQIRERHPAARVVLTSGIIDRAEREKWKKAGVRASLRKPFNADEFLRTIRDATEN